MRVIASFRATLIALALSASANGVAAPLIPFGVFTSIETSNGEHWAGWELRTWVQSGKLVGFVLFAEGSIGTEDKAEFRDLKFDLASGRLSFWAWLPNYEARVDFSGVVWADRAIGTFIFSYHQPERDVVLLRCCDDAPAFKRFESFEEMATEYELQPNQALHSTPAADEESAAGAGERQR